VADQGPTSELLRKLIAEFGTPRCFTSSYQFAKGPLEEAPPFEPLDALEINHDVLSDKALAALEAIEEVVKDSPAEWMDFRWKLSAFLHLQDILDAPLYEAKELKIFFEQYYFYYESRTLLAESFLAVLNGLYTASDALLRPFLEFSLLQNYYYRVSRDSRDYAAFEKFLGDKQVPSWNTVMKKALPKDDFCRPIRFRMSSHLAALSQSVLHVYHPEDSPQQYRRQPHGHSIEGLFFWHKISLIVDAALWVYYVNFPMVFYPTDVLRKFGFNGPVGVVADPQTAHFVRKSLSETDYEAFKSYNAAECAPTVQWVQSRPDLSDDAIRSSWSHPEEDHCPPDLQHAFGLHTARFRALRLAMAFHAAERLQDVSDEFLGRVSTLAGWKEFARWERHRGSG